MDKIYNYLKAKTIIIVLTICLLLTACGGQNQETAGGANGTIQSSQGEQSDQTSQPDQTPCPEYLGMDQSAFEHCMDLSTISVKLTAGADITLYMDENGTILAVHCHNDEAIAVCSATPVVELDFGSVWFALLNEMLVKGYLENGSRLAVNIVEEEGSSPQFPLYDVIDEMFQKVAEDSGADIGMNMNSDFGSVGAVIQGGGNAGGEERPDDSGGQSDGGEQQPEGDRYLEVERDENGNLIRTLEEDDEGNRIERFYRSDGSAETEIIKNADGYESMTSFREDGTIASVMEIHPDGARTETIMNERGIRVSLTELQADGSKIEQTFTETGEVLYLLHTFSDGSNREADWVYDENGRLRSYREAWSNGRICEETYDETGVLKTRFERNEDGHTENATYSKSGKLLSLTYTTSDGGVGEERLEYDEQDNLIQMYHKNPDGSYNVTTYYANGNRKTQEIVFTNGRSELWHYTEDGTTGTTTNSAGTTTEIYHTNGKTAKRTFTASPSAGFDFTYEESTYDENGTMLTHTKIRNNGVIGVSTYHYDKSHTTVFTYPDGGGHTEYWYGNNLLGGIGSNGVPWGVTVPGADYSGLDYSGTIGKG